MGEINQIALSHKLNPTCRTALQNAAGLAMQRTNDGVKLEHFFVKLLEEKNSDLYAIAKFFELDFATFATDLGKALDKARTGFTGGISLRPELFDALKEAFVLASINFDTYQIRSGHVILAMMTNENLTTFSRGISRELEKIDGKALVKDFISICAESIEAEQAKDASAAAKSAPGGGPAKPTKTPSLDQFTVDLTARAAEGAIDPVLGRDDEIRQIVDILCRRRQNNPILTGEAGVGKTAVVEGFALKIAANDVPPALQNVSIRSLDLALLQAGASVKGMFEERLKSVIEEVKSSEKPIILFIDEAHTMIGAGGQAGQGDAANLLKPALARGELRTIAATTWAEYKKYFERDAALARRFQVVKVEEPDEENAIQMMRGLVSTLESHHNIRILNEAIEDAVKLSNRYIAGRQLPDKSVSLLDTTCARINLSQNSTPPPIEDCERRIEQMAVAIDILERESVAGVDHSERVKETEQEKENAEAELVQLKERYEKESALVAEINECYDKLNGTFEEPAEQTDGAEGDADSAAEDTNAETVETTELTDEERAAIEGKLETLERDLKESQGEAPLVHVCCDSNAVAETVGAWTGIPVGRMVANEIQTVLNLKQNMERQVVGQSHALEQIAQSIQTSRAKLTDPNKPIGVFMLAGTSGVGKTETAIALAELLYGGEQNMTVINMSEFKEEHKVSLLMGSPPGYVGFGEGGVLTEAVRRKPYSVVLLDEMEKAHPGVQDIFYQVFDKGHMKDSEGRDIDFKNTVVIMTTNAGTDFIKSVCEDPDTMPDAEGFTQAVYPELLKTFKPAFLGRITILPYYPLADDVMKKIIRLKLNKVVRQITENYQAKLTYSDDLVDAIAARCTEVDTGARNVDKILNRSLLPELSAEFLSYMADGREIHEVEIGIDSDSNFEYKLS